MIHCWIHLLVLCDLWKEVVFEIAEQPETKICISQGNTNSLVSLCLSLSLALWMCLLSQSWLVQSLDARAPRLMRSARFQELKSRLVVRLTAPLIATSLSPAHPSPSTWRTTWLLHGKLFIMAFHNANDDRKRGSVFPLRNWGQDFFNV